MTSSSKAAGRHKKSEFLLELFSEEIPARMQAKAAADLQKLVTAKLKDASLEFDTATTYVTARRLTLHIEGLSSEQPDVSEERRGPRADAPEQAIAGFLKGAGLTRDEVEVREEKKGTFLYAVIEKAGRPAADVIVEFLPDLIRTFPWPKSQRWGDGTLRWVRPLHSIICLLDGKVVEFDLGEGLVSGNSTRGHRFLGPQEFSVDSFADYAKKLDAAYVILEREKRKEHILTEAQNLAKEAGLELVEDSALLDEVAGLSEYPVPLMGGFEESFLEVPAEALTSAMRSHQKYFSLKSKNGKLANKFICVANMDDASGEIIKGNERVLNARLSDTKFFWDQDLKISLDDRLPRLDDIVFHAKLGTVGQRVERLVELSGHIAEKIGANVEQAKRAAQLCKTDLVSGMVGEFADLQGLMGKYYAQKQNEVPEVASAIADHYSPKGPSDKCPTDMVTVAVALAEKLDTVVGFFGIDEKPTGSKDPFALRRAALGIIRLIVENKLRLGLVELCGVSARQYKGCDLSDAGQDLGNFFSDRLTVHLKEQGVRHDLITAVFALKGEDDLVRLLARIDALKTFLDTQDGQDLLSGYKRAVNILKAEEKKDGPVTGDATAGTVTEEKDLYERLGKVSVAATEAVESEEFERAMSELATLRGPIDAFFDKVTVNSDDQGERQNRLRLLSQIRRTMNMVADFSKIEG